METIRQLCPQCRATLELPASACGRMARCPSCQTTFRVPEADSHGSMPALNESSTAEIPSAETRVPSGQTPSSPWPKSAPEPYPPWKAETSNPFTTSAPTSGNFSSNPYSVNPALVTGEAYQVDKGALKVRRAKIDEIFSATFSIFGARWQPLVLSGLAALLILILVGAIGIVINLVFQANGFAASIIAMSVFGFFSNLLSWYLFFGLMRVGIMASRGQETGPAHLFIAPSLMVRMLVIPFFLSIITVMPNILPFIMGELDGDLSVVFMTIGGSMAAGLVNSLFLWPIWPTFYLMVDGRPEEGSALSVGLNIGTTNLFNGFLFGIFCMVLHLASSLTCGIGLVVTQPLMTLFGAVAYLAMTTQPISNPNATPYQSPYYGQPNSVPPQ